MNTKQKGDIAEQVATLAALKRGWEVLKPLGDRLPYDLVFDVDGKLVKIQVKSAWFNDKAKNFIVESRRTKTNRREMIRSHYKSSDFDFALIYIEDINVFYVMPVDVFISYKGAISLVEDDKRQRRPKSAKYRETWKLINAWAARLETT